MHQHDLPVYILSLLILAIAVERFTEFFKNSALFAPIRGLIMKFYARLCIKFENRRSSVEFVGIAVSHQRKRRPIKWLVRKLVNLIRLVLIPPFWFLANVLKCGWCLSGQLSIAAAFLMPGGLFEQYALDNVIIKFGAIWGLSNYINTQYELLRRGRVQYLNVVLTEPETEQEDPDIEIEE